MRRMSTRTARPSNEIRALFAGESDRLAPVIEVTTLAGRVRFRVRVLPRSSENAFRGEQAGALKVALTAPPVEGAANAALIELLADALGVPKRCVRITAGQSSRDKSIEVDGVTEAEVRGLV
jgi:uncharacterized protein (TIGR00251 family)